MATIIRAFERSEQSHDAFCIERDLNVGTFRSWLYSLRRSTTLGREVQMLPVELVAPSRCASGPTEGTGEVIVVVAGVDIRVRVGTDVQYVAGLVDELRRC